MHLILNKTVSGDFKCRAGHVTKPKVVSEEAPALYYFA